MLPTIGDKVRSTYRRGWYGGQSGTVVRVFTDNGPGNELALVRFSNPNQPGTFGNVLMPVAVLASA